MATFALVFPTFMRFEGGYSNDPDDRGQETYKGIARKAHPTWSGWQIVDAEKRKRGGSLPHNYFILSAVLDKLVELVAKKTYWDFYHGDQIKSQEVAEIIVDWGWASGTVTAAKKVQELLGLHPDGRFGPATLQAINKQNPEKLFFKIQQARLKFVEDIVKRNPSQAKYINGWKRRILAYESPETRKRWLALKIGAGAVGLAGAAWAYTKYSSDKK